MSYLQVNYLQAYTDLRTGKMDFHQFMDVINRVYEFGHQRGTLHGIEMCKDDVGRLLKERD
jgi:hypothetical protein